MKIRHHSPWCTNGPKSTKLIGRTAGAGERGVADREDPERGDVDPDDRLRRDQVVAPNEQTDPLARGGRGGLDAVDAVRADGSLAQALGARGPAATGAAAPGLPIGMPVAGDATAFLSHGRVTVPARGRPTGSPRGRRIGSVCTMSDTGIAGAASATGPDGLTADEVARACAGRAGQRRRRPHEPQGLGDPAGQHVHPVQRDPRHRVRAHPRVR